MNYFDNEFEQLVQSLGYRKEEDAYRAMSQFKITHPFPPIHLPKGFRLKSLADDNDLGKMDQVKSGGTLLNQRFLPDVLKGSDGLVKLSQLIRGYFRLDGHHIQFNVVATEILKAAQENPEDYRDLLVRVAGYSDYFCDLTPDLQAEIMQRTAQEEF